MGQLIVAVSKSWGHADQVLRSWFDKLTMNGEGALTSNVLFDELFDRLRANGT